MARMAVTVTVAMMVAACAASGVPSNAPDMAWEVCDAPGRVADVVSMGDLMVAGGTTAPAGDPAAHPAIWLSPDGWTWEPGTVAGDGDIAALVVGDRQLLAAGSRPVGSGTQASIWASPDGKVWTIAGEDGFVPAAGCASTTAEDVAAGPDGYVAVGTEWGEGSCGQHAAAWISRDGRTWSRTRAPTGGHAMHRVVASEGGYVAAGSATAAPNEGMRAAFWFSPDGESWTQAPDGEGLHGAEATALARDKNGFLAVGVAITGRSSDAMVPAAWRSSDGRAWSRIAPEGLTWDAETARPAEVTTLALTSELVALPSGTLALGAGMSQRVGQDGSAGQASPWRYLAWVSTSGDSWMSLPDDPALLVGTVNTYVLGPSAALVHDDRLFLFGTRWPASSAEQVDPAGLPTIWTTDVSAIERGT